MGEQPDGFSRAVSFLVKLFAFTVFILLAGAAVLGAVGLIRAALSWGMGL